MSAEDEEDQMLDVNMDRFDEEAAGEPEALGVVGKSLSTCRIIFDNIRCGLKWSTIIASILVRS